MKISSLSCLFCDIILLGSKIRSLVTPTCRLNTVYFSRNCFSVQVLNFKLPYPDQKLTFEGQFVDHMSEKSNIWIVRLSRTKFFHSYIENESSSTISSDFCTTLLQVSSMPPELFKCEAKLLI